MSGREYIVGKPYLKEQNKNKTICPGGLSGAQQPPERKQLLERDYEWPWLIHKALLWAYRS